MADQNYISRINGDALFVPALAATVYAAHENSLFLGGELIPVVNAPNGVLQVPEISKVAAQTISVETTSDLETRLPTMTKNTINCDLYGARSVVRDLGNIDPSEIGRALGMSVAAAFDTAVMGVVGDLTAQEITDAGGLTVDEIAKAVGGIRGAGETGQLFGIVGAAHYATLMSDIGSTAFAGGDVFQGQALRSGFFGNLMGVQLFVSSYLDDTNTGVTAARAAIFGADAMRIAMQRNVELEVGRRPEAVGQDVVASLMAGVGLIDAGRGRMLVDAV